VIRQAAVLARAAREQAASLDPARVRAQVAEARLHAAAPRPLATQAPPMLRVPSGQIAAGYVRYAA